VTKEQERARARRRQQKLAEREAQKAAERARNRQVVGVVVAILVVVALFIAVSSRLGRDSDAAGASSPTTGATAVEGCTGAPAPQPSAKQLALPATSVAAGKTYTATLTTNCGDITLDLDGAKAPQAVSSFVSLTQHGYYDQSPCHRLTTSSIFVLQCGDPTGRGDGGPGYTYAVENAPQDGTYPTGTLAMARTNEPDTNGGQFFIVYQDTKLPTAGGGYTIFGTVTEGMDIVEKIAAAGVSGGAGDGAPAAPISILKVAVTEKKA
jgi:peptidyl-prolyl cis-trans isomerase B (cyclophilin B)